MKYYKKSILLLLTTVSSFYFSQDHKFLKYPTFDESELKKEFSLIDKSAPAEIIYRSVDHYINTNGSLDSEHHAKIKIYDKSNADEWLNIQIPKFDQENITKFEATVYNIVDGKVVKTVLNKKENLVEKLTDGIKVLKLALPNITNGSVIEYHYKKTGYSFGGLDYDLEYNIPVVYEEYNFSHPQSVKFEFNSVGKIITPKYHASYVDDKPTAKYQIFRFGYENMKPYKSENFLKSENRYKGKLRPNFFSFAGGAFEEVNNNWSFYADKLNTFDFFGIYLRTNVKDVVPNEIKTYYDRVERCNKILKLVNQKVKWNKKNSFLASQSLRQTLKNASGNSADINLLVVALLRDAGIDANPMLISTVDNGILNILRPNLSELNYVIATAKIDGQLLLLDATSVNSSVNVLPERAWNNFGILVEKDNATDISFENTNVSEKDYKIVGTLDANNAEVIGTLSNNQTKLFAIKSYEDYDNNNSKYDEEFKNYFAATISNVESKLESNNDFGSKMNFKTSSQIDKVGNKIIFNPLLFLTKNELAFDQVEERKNPIDFTSAFIINKHVEIEIPEGYTVSSLPKPKKLSTDDKEVDYNYSVEVVGKKLVVKSKFSVASQNYPKDYYPIFKQVWQVILGAESQVVSLTKK